MTAAKKILSVMTSIGALVLVSLIGCGGDNPSPDKIPAVTKTNEMQIYMHYMPWFQSKPVSGYWGSHWKMDNKNPDNVDTNGKREIASHYYPLIGPYDSSDPDVIEYHLLLMKYAGVDAVLIDWYGSHNLYDYRTNLNAGNAFIEKLSSVGLKFAIVYEEYTAGKVGDETSKTPIEAAQADIEYLQSKYYTKAEYVKISQKPLLLTFGPRYFKQPAQWDQIFANASPKPKFLPLWSHASYVGDHDNGEYAWIDFNSDLSQLNAFYNKSAEIIIGSAYPGFHDFYVEGGWGTSYGFFDYNNGETLRSTLQKAKDRDATYLQLVTWNDFGEGTVIEPTLEHGFEPLEIIMEFTGVNYSMPELEVIHQLYLKRKAFAGNAENQKKLDEAFQHLARLEPDKAETILNQLN